MIYLNHAGTSFPKPDVVQQAVSEFSQLPPTEYGRVFEECQKAVCDFFHISNPDRFMFTTSCTSSLAVALDDFPWSENTPNNKDCLIISSMEHHALSRWYHKLPRERGIEAIIIPRAEDGGPLDLELLEKTLQERSIMTSSSPSSKTLVAMTMASNVTGEILPCEQIVALCHKYNAYSLLDGAQTAGIIPINLQQLNPDIFVFAGHKGTLTIHGLGGLYISERMNMTCPTAVCAYVPGGKKEHANNNKPTMAMPSYCDTGSAPMMALAGLTAALQWMTNHETFSWEQRIQHRLGLVQQLRTGLMDLSEDFEILGQAFSGDQIDPTSMNHPWSQYTGAVSIRLHPLKYAHHQQNRIREIAQHLQKHDIVASMGFQCAPLAHEALGTHEHGTLRFSVGVFTTHHEIETLLDELQAAIQNL